MTDSHPSSPVNVRAYRAALVCFAIAVVGGLTAAYGYWSDRTESLLGIGLAIALVGIGAGLVAWAKFLDLDEHVVQQRERVRATDDERADFHDVVVETSETIGRRRVLAVLFSGSLASMFVGFVGPIGSLGPKPRGERGRTGWSAGTRLVTSDGAPVVADVGTFDQLATVFPEGQIGRDDSQVVLLRLRPELLTQRTVDGGSADGWVAYSKICTHAGCSVGLFGIDDRPPDVVRQLVCPCHQSAFDPVDAAEPVGGPAPRPLPQLPIEIDAEGFLVARAGFEGPVGPITWSEG